MVLTMATVHARLSRGLDLPEPAAAGPVLGFEGLAVRGA